MKIKFTITFLCALVMVLFACGCSADKVTTVKTETNITVETTEKSDAELSDDSAQKEENSDDATDETATDSMSDRTTESGGADVTSPEEQATNEVEIDFSDLE